MNWLRAWVALRCVGPLFAVVLRPSLPGELLAGLLGSADYAHGLVKWGLSAWMVVLWRAPAALAAVALLLLGSGLAVALGERPRRVVLAGLLVALVLLPLDPWWPAFAPFLFLSAVNLLPLRVPAALAWVPGAELLLPRGVALALGAGPRLERVVATFGAPLLFLVWLAADALVVGDARREEVGQWPADRVDPRARLVEQAGPGIICEYHDVDLVGDRVVVVAEGSHRLLSFPRDLDAPPLVRPLPAPWGEIFGLVLDAESDPASGLTWFLDGPRRVSAARMDGTGWVDAGASPPLPRPEHHLYTRWLPERSQLALIAVNATTGPADGSLLLLPTPALGPVIRRPLSLDGRPAPTLRDIEWLPPLGRFVVAPNWGDRLYLLDPDNGRLTPWVALPTMNGKMTWSAATGRLYVAQPNRFGVVVIDPARGEVVDTVPTQPGVRPVAVDAARGLLVTASVATGQVWVQRLADGAIVDRLGTFMPMVRELELDLERGHAWLSTWTALYVFPYAPDAAPLPGAGPTP